MLHRDAGEADGYRVLDYERDILGELDWEGLHFLSAASLDVDGEARLTRTLARVSLDRSCGETGQTTFELHQEAVATMPEEGLDIPFLVRQLLDVIPNPWQGVRVLEEALGVLRKRGLSEEALYVNRLELIRLMKEELRTQVDTLAERLFREKLDREDITLRLTTANDLVLRWKLAEEMSVEVTDDDAILRRRNGDPLERSLFEKVYVRDLNELEKNTAWYADESEPVKWWHRIAVGGSSYSLQGWQRNKVYPDFLVCLEEKTPGQWRFTLLETKGEHLKGNDDTKYKQTLFELLTRHASQPLSTVGDLELGDQSPPIRFKMIMEENWKQALADEGL